MADKPVIDSPLRQQEKHELQSLNKRLEGYIIQLEQKFSGQVDDLSRRLAAAEAEARKYVQQLETQVSTISTLNGQITSLHAERAEFEREIQALKTFRRQDQDLLQQRAREIQKLKEDLLTSEGRVTVAVQKADRLEQEVNYLKLENQRLARLQQTPVVPDIIVPPAPIPVTEDGIRARLELEYKAKYSVLHQQNRASMFDHFKKELQAQHEKWQARYTRRTEEFIEQGRRIGALQQDINDIKNAQAGEVVESRVKLSEAENEVSRLRARVSELEADKIKHTQEIQNLNAIIQKLQEELDELQRAQQRYDSLEIELRAYRLLLESGEEKLSEGSTTSSKRQKQQTTSSVSVVSTETTVQISTPI